MAKVIFHIDIDAFYASVEELDNPLIKGKAVIVGAKPGTRGVVSACSYEARRYGIHSAMPISEAQRRCPHAIFVPVRMKRYLEISKKVMRMLEDAAPEFQQISIDEAFTDFSGTERLLGPPEEIARSLKTTIKQEFGLNISIGIAPHRYLAKLASDACKPDGLLQVKEGTGQAFLDSLQLKDLWGVGKKTLSRLEELNIRTIPQLRSFPIDLLKPMLGEAASEFLYKAVRGKDLDIFSAEPKSHSLSHEVTFETDIKDLETLKKVILELSQAVMDRLLGSESQSRTIFIKIRYYDFSSTLAQQTMKHWLTSSEEIAALALELLKKRWDGHTPIRLIGVGAAQVVRGGAQQQLELFIDPLAKKKRVEETIIRLKQKMKGLKLTKASFIKHEES
jgi:DNA polymerase-4